MNKDKLVTVGVSLYNYENYIVQCLESVVNQTYENIEIVVVDDGSKDNSYEVAKKYLESQNKKKFIINTRENKGVCETFNEIARDANGHYISYIDADDYWEDFKIEEQVKFLENNEEISLVHSNSKMIDIEDKIIEVTDFSNRINSGDVYEAMIYGKGGVNPASYLYKTSIFKEIGYYDPNFIFEDTDFLLRFTKKYKVGFINKVMTICRRHGKNLSDDSNRLVFYNEELIKIYKKNIDDPKLKNFVINRMYRKTYLRALRNFNLKLFFRYYFKYLTSKNSNI